MKDRQFMTLLGLVVAAGLVMGLIASRVTGNDGGAAGAAGTANAAAATKLIGGDPDAPRPSAADEAVSAPPASPSLAGDASAQNGDPGPTAKDPPEMQGPGTGDAPGTAYQPSQPDMSSSDTSTPSGDSPPQ